MSCKLIRIRQTVNLVSVSHDLGSFTPRCLPNHQDPIQIHFHCRLCYLFSATETLLSCQLHSGDFLSFFFLTLVATFSFSLNKNLLTVANHIFPCQGLNSHFCSKIPNFWVTFIRQLFLPIHFYDQGAYLLGPLLLLEGVEQCLFLVFSPTTWNHHWAPQAGLAPLQLALQK